MYTVEVKSVAGWTTHSSHDSYRDAVDQADLVHGRVLCGTGLSDESAWGYAVSEQGFVGSFADWQAQSDEEREEYELGAGAVGK